jgi:hypothetical protein
MSIEVAVVAVAVLLFLLVLDLVEIVTNTVTPVMPEPVRIHQAARFAGFFFWGLVLGVSPERFSRMLHGATCHWDDHTMPGHPPWDATCHLGLLGGWNVGVSGLA